MTTPHTQSGWLIEGNGQPHANFEVALTWGTAEHWWRDNGNSDLPWRGPNRIAEASGLSHAEPYTRRWHAPTLLLSTYGSLEFVAIEDSGAVQRAVHYYRDFLGWHGPHEAYVTSTGSVPPASLAHLQRNAGNPPTFQLLVTRRGRELGLAHLARREDVNGWREVDLVAPELEIDGVTMIDSNYGNLEVLATADDGLYFMWQGQQGWSTPYLIGRGSGRPAMLQSSFGRGGNFEVVVPAPSDSDGLLFYWRNNDLSDMPWSPSVTIPGSTGRGGYDDVALIQSSYDGHLELLARRRGAGNPAFDAAPVVDVYWRERDPGWSWHGPFSMI